MTPDEFNLRALTLTEIKGSHVTALTRIAQAELGLVVDGKCGPKTRAALEAQASPLPTGPRTPQTVGEAVVAFGLTLIDQGEEGANNAGSFIIRIGGQQGMEWCALSAGYAWRETLTRSGKTPGPEWYRRPGVPEPGALNLLRAVAAAAAASGGPGRFLDPARALPGDLLGWDHGDGHGHVGLVRFVDEDEIVRTLEGNVGRYPAKYRELTHDVRKEPRFWGFVRPVL